MYIFATEIVSTGLLFGLESLHASQFAIKGRRTKLSNKYTRVRTVRYYVERRIYLRAVYPRRTILADDQSK